MTQYVFRFEDTREVVALDHGHAFGPFNSVREAMSALWGEFFTDDPSNLCYFLTTTDNDEPIYVTMSNEITFVDNNGNRID